MSVPKEPDTYKHNDGIVEMVNVVICEKRHYGREKQRYIFFKSFLQLARSGRMCGGYRAQTALHVIWWRYQPPGKKGILVRAALESAFTHSGSRSGPVKIKMVRQHSLNAQVHAHGQTLSGVRQLEIDASWANKDQDRCEGGLDFSHVDKSNCTVMHTIVPVKCAIINVIHRIHQNTRCFVFPPNMFAVRLPDLRVKRWM